MSLLAYNSCGVDTMEKVVCHGSIGVNEVINLHDGSIYPNPSEGVFTVNLTSINSFEVLVEVLDVRGAIVFTQNVGTIQGDISQPINADQLVAGIYFVRIRVGNENAVFRIVIE